MNANFNFDENDFDTYLINYYNLGDIIEPSFSESKMIFKVSFLTDLYVSENESIITKLLEDYLNTEFIYIASPECNIAL